MLLALTLLLLLQPTTKPVATADNLTAEAIAARVAQVAGAKVWPDVTRLQFTFNVERDGKLAVSAQHDWDVKAGKDTVTWGGKTVTVDIATMAHEGEQKEAFARWTNDSYWLLAPLKLTDGGVQFGNVMTTRDMPPSRANMTMSFENVGLTPGDQYDLSISLRDNQITHWTYRPNADTSRGFTWEDYQDFNGLTLSTQHKSDDGSTRVFFTDIQVTTADE